jgi:crossover junction endodeoxyribonuclease RusA
MLIITLPWPNPKLAPNRIRGHWAKVGDAKRSAFEAAYMLTFQAARQHVGEWYPLSAANVPVTLTFNPPDKRRRDLDGLLSSMKQALDGVATALTIDDEKFSPITLRRGEPVKGGAVILEIGALA